MKERVPHIVQYQGSKRILASQILSFMPHKFNRLIEPFSGMAAMTIASAYECRANTYHINDLNKPLIKILQLAIDSPNELIEKYTTIWNSQFDYQEGHIQHFYTIRDKFNNGEQTAEHMLYLLARCVKGAVRYCRNGKFNQSPDKRRHGTHPKRIHENVSAISSFLRGKTSFSSLDYKELLETTTFGDLVYMDPPYQGVTNTRDRRYLSGVDFEEFVAMIEVLNTKNIDYIISYDGQCGGKAYGEDLPKELQCTKLLLNAGLSSQATLLGNRHVTYEALYVSKNLKKYVRNAKQQASLFVEAV